MFLSTFFTLHLLLPSHLLPPLCPSSTFSFVLSLFSLLHLWYPFILRLPVPISPVIHFFRFHSSHKVKMPRYDYDTAMRVLSDQDKGRLIACYLSMENPNQTV